MIAHVPVAISTDRAAARAAFRERFPIYGRLPFYAEMFALAGYPVDDDGRMPDGLVDDLLVSGTADQVRARLEVAPTISAADLEAAALADDVVQRFLEGKSVRKVIVREPGLVNIVAT